LNDRNWTWKYFWDIIIVQSLYTKTEYKSTFDWLSIKWKNSTNLTVHSYFEKRNALQNDNQNFIQLLWNDRLLVFSDDLRDFHVNSGQAGRSGATQLLCSGVSI